MNGSCKYGPAEGLEVILTAKSVDKLVTDMFIGYQARLGFNLINLDPSLVTPKRTIEIRLHEGTLDDEAIYHWAKIFIGLAEFANVVRDRHLRTWLRRYITRSEKYDVFQLLLDLKMPREAMYYARRTINIEGTETKMGKEAQAALDYIARMHEKELKGESTQFLILH